MNMRILKLLWLVWALVSGFTLMAILFWPVYPAGNRDPFEVWTSLVKFLVLSGFTMICLGIATLVGAAKSPRRRM